MNLIKPKNLKTGDTISIIAPAGAVDSVKISKSVKYFENKGFKVKLGKNILKKYNYMAGTDEERLSDIHDAFKDSEVSAIICARGGYGSLRLINKIDFNLIHNNPKIFCGYSDITVLNAMILKKSGLVTFSGAMAQSDFSEDNINKYTEEKLFETLKNNKVELVANNPIYYGQFKDATGIIWGGNLSTVTTLCGQDFIPDEDFIFFMEDLNEPAYKIDRYLTQLLNMENFRNKVQGVAIGDLLYVDNEKYLSDIFNMLAKELNIPVVTGFPFSHEDPKATVPYGALGSLSSTGLIVENYLDE